MELACEVERLRLLFILTSPSPPQPAIVVVNESEMKCDTYLVTAANVTDTQIS